MVIFISGLALLFSTVSLFLSGLIIYARHNEIRRSRLARAEKTRQYVAIGEYAKDHGISFDLKDKHRLFDR